MLNGLYQFLIINNFSAVVTFIVGLFAFGVYSLQKRDEKVNAARVLLSEARNAERKIEELNIRLEQFSTDLPSILPINSWKKYSHLFARDLDQDELEQVNNFYSLCEAIEDLVKRNNNYFWLTTEYRAKILQSKLMDLIEKVVNENIDNEVREKLIKELKVSILDRFTGDEYWYTPNKPTTGLKEYALKIEKLTVSPVGIKLKAIARL